ncbi:MAG: hypothetical protein IJW64_03670 [Clostridia bacterium]|nr:hypothetical protein [Clostridia bacterium]
MKKLLTTLLSVMLTFSLCFFATSCLVTDESDTPEQATAVTTVDEFLNSIMDGAEIVLGADLEFEHLVIPEGVSLTVDLGGFTISSSLKEEGRHHYVDNHGTLVLKGAGEIKARGVQNFGTLTVETGVTITSIDENGGAAIWNEGELTVNGGTFKVPFVGDDNDHSGPGCLNNYGGSATINGGTFISNNKRVYSIISTGNMVITDAIVVGVQGAVAVDGGYTRILGGVFTATQWHALHSDYEGEAYVYGGTFTGKESDIKANADSYIFIGRNASLTSNTTLGNVVTEKVVSSVEEFASAIADKNYIVLDADLEIAQVTVPENVTLTIDLNNHNLTTTLQREGRHFYVDNYGALTLKGTGTINARGVQNFGTLTVWEGVTINSVDANGGAAIWNEGELTINGGTFHAEYAGSSSDDSGPGCLNNVGGTAVINGGLFTSNNLRTYAIISTGDLTINFATVEAAHGAVGLSGGTATVNDGTFHASKHYGFYASKATATLNGGTFTGDHYEVDVYADADATITIGQNAVLTHNKTNGKGTIIFEKITNAETAIDAQTALDSAVSGTVIQLAENVHYGTLYLRQSDLSVSVDVSNWAGDSDVERFRSIENVTILGADGATVDNIKIEAGTYTPEILHSNSDEMRYLQSYIAIKNLKISGVTFTGAQNAFVISGKVSVDGLTLENCAMQDDGNNVLLYATGTTTSVYTDKLTDKVFLTQGIKNVTVKGCTVIGAKQVIELRETENVTISNNVFKNIVARDILLATNSGCSYTGEINIVGNLSDGSTERFLRASNVNAKVTLSNNVVSNWSSSEGDTDIVKFSGNGSNTTFTLEGNVWNGETDDEAKLSGTVNLG